MLNIGSCIPLTNSIQHTDQATISHVFYTNKNFMTIQDFCFFRANVR